jgi:hypothetical protein
MQMNLLAFLTDEFLNTGDAWPVLSRWESSVRKGTRFFSS